MNKSRFEQSKVSWIQPKRLKSQETMAERIVFGNRWKRIITEESSQIRTEFRSAKYEILEYLSGTFLKGSYICWHLKYPCAWRHQKMSENGDILM